MVSSSSTNIANNNDDEDDDNYDNDDNDNNDVDEDDPLIKLLQGHSLLQQHTKATFHKYQSTNVCTWSRDLESGRNVVVVVVMFRLNETTNLRRFLTLGLSGPLFRLFSSFQYNFYTALIVN